MDFDLETKQACQINLCLSPDIFCLDRMSNFLFGTLLLQYPEVRVSKPVSARDCVSTGAPGNGVQVTHSPLHTRDKGLVSTSS